MQCCVNRNEKQQRDKCVNIKYTFINNKKKTKKKLRKKPKTNEIKR